jgi:hypothetical protein
MSRILLLLLLFFVFSFPAVGHAVDEIELPGIPDEIIDGIEVLEDYNESTLPTADDLTDQAIEQTSDMGTLNVTKESGGTIFVVPKEPTASQLVPKTFPNY